MLVRLEVGRLLWRHTLVTSWLVGDRRWGRVRGQRVHRRRHVPIAREVPALLVVDFVAPVPLISWGGERCVGHPLAGQAVHWEIFWVVSVWFRIPIPGEGARVSEVGTVPPAWGSETINIGTQVVAVAILVRMVRVPLEHHNRGWLVVQTSAAGTERSRQRLLSPRCEDKSPWDGHDDDNIVKAHLGDVHQVDGKDLVANHNALTAVDRGLQGNPRNEDSVSSIHPVALADVETQGLTGPLHNFHKAGARVRVLEKESKVKGGCSRWLPEKVGIWSQPLSFSLLDCKVYIITEKMMMLFGCVASFLVI